MKTKVFAAILISFFFVSGCGSSGSNSSSSSSTNSVMGIFLDAAVSGLSYSSASHNGKTDSSGQYSCASGETVTFQIGALPIGETTCDSITTPYDLEGTTDREDAKSINIARLLIALDEDQSPDNGISLMDAAQGFSDFPADFPPVDFSSHKFLTAVLQRIDSSRSLDSSSDARAHISGSLDSHFSGTYKGLSTRTSSNPDGYCDDEPETKQVGMTVSFSFGNKTFDATEDTGETIQGTLAYRDMKSTYPEDDGTTDTKGKLHRNSMEGTWKWSDNTGSCSGTFQYDKQ